MLHVISTPTRAPASSGCGRGTAIELRVERSPFAALRPEGNGRYRMGTRTAAPVPHRLRGIDDGTTWTRDDQAAGIGVSASGWDSESIAYPYVFDHAAPDNAVQRHGYGKTGSALPCWKGLMDVRPGRRGSAQDGYCVVENASPADEELAPRCIEPGAQSSRSRGGAPRAPARQAC